MVCGTVATPGSCRIHQIRQKLLKRLFLGEDMLELCTHGLPALARQLRLCRTASFLLRHPGQALAPERILGQAVLEKGEEVEPDYGMIPTDR